MAALLPVLACASKSESEALELEGCPAGTDCVLEADDYDRACSVDADCVSVFVGDVCQCDCTQVSAIAKRAASSYDQARSAIRCENVCGPCPELHVPRCVAGRCEAERCPGPVRHCAAACGADPTVTACTCPAGMVDTSTCH